MVRSGRVSLSVNAEQSCELHSASWRHNITVKFACRSLSACLFKTHANPSKNKRSFKPRTNEIIRKIIRRSIYARYLVNATIQKTIRIWSRITRSSLNRFFLFVVVFAFFLHTFSEHFVIFRSNILEKSDPRIKTNKTGHLIVASYKRRKGYCVCLTNTLRWLSCVSGSFSACRS